MQFRLPILQWEISALEPFLSRDAIECHYYGHHKAYIDKVNDLTESLGLKKASLEWIILNHDGALFNNAAQAWSHTFFWQGLKPKSSPQVNENEALTAAIEDAFGSMAQMRARFLDCGETLFGAGWTWLVANDRGELDLINTQNADTPLRFENSKPLWVCDIWEHAYYVDYRYQRREYLEGIWNHIDWNFAAANLAADKLPNMSRLMISEDVGATFPAQSPSL